ncbi:hypothetical protein [Vibrio splendidus]|nr:hypothetical protein [Vibrio splendidus]
MDATQRKNGDYAGWDELDVILRAYRYAVILAVWRATIDNGW